MSNTSTAAAAGAANPTLGNAVAEVDAVVVGAGFAGMYMLHKLREIGLSAKAFEAGDGVGGTWYWNRYPGARCDIESLEYSYQFDEDLQQAWDWSERYATQPELLAYANHVADRFELRRDIAFETRVTGAAFDEAANRWTVTTRGADGSSARTRARFFILATGCLSSTNLPEFPGRDDFAGAAYHTGNWPHEGVDFTGKRVAVIGTGSSAIQSIPHIAAQASHLFVFQRTPNYSIPAHNGPIPDDLRARIKANYPQFRADNANTGFGSKFDPGASPELAIAAEKSAFDVDEAERRAVYEARWERGGLGFLSAFADLVFDKRANDTAAEFVREKIRATVKDPQVAELLAGKSIVGCKRLCVDSGYYETFNRDNVTLVDISGTPIERITPAGVQVGGHEYAVDAIVYATGFDAMTGTLVRMDIRGRGGLALADKWAEGPGNYLGLSTVGFPNMFIITGPGSPSVLSNMLPSIEQHVRWIGRCLADMQARQAQCIEPTPEAEANWVGHVNDVANSSLYPGCNSWYLGANVPGKARVFMPYLGVAPYAAKCEEVVARDYEGFAMR
jgi:cyclohexanone monooxygenase